MDRIPVIINGLNMEITQSDIDGLRHRLNQKSADLLAYSSTANDVFHYILDCKRVMDGQAAIIKHLEAQNGHPDTSSKGIREGS